MKKCPNCGKLNFPNSDTCIECNAKFPMEKAVIEEKTDVANNLPTPKEGMHWFLALLIMAGTRLAGGWLLSLFVPTFPYITSYAVPFTFALAISYFSIYVWFRLTVDRYSGASLWAFYMYFLLIISPISTSSSYIIAQTNIFGGTSYFVILSVLCVVIGPLVFASSRKKNT